MPHDSTIHVRPDKHFFVDMLTKDITLTDSILDLVDNAVDSYVQVRHVDVMKLLLNGQKHKRQPARIDIRYDTDHFRVSDTCGGMTIEDAAEKAFLLGNAQATGALNGLSVYGIGMKRAIFKMGRLSTIESQAPKGFFRIKFDVGKWLKTEEWDLAFEHMTPGAVPTRTRPAGANIEITKLLPAVQARFRQTSFAAELAARLRTTYALFMEAGLEITLNGKRLSQDLPTISSSKEIQPARRLLHDDGVDILILAGVTPASDTRPHGWYVFCNGRMVVQADKTATTGWGDVLPGFHSKFNHFIGYSYFRAKDPRLLPWRTTKQGVDRDAAVYQHALREMGLQGRKVTGFLSSQYPSDLESELPLEREVLRSATSIPVTKVARKDQSFALQLPKRQRGAGVTISYQRTLEQVQRVRERIGKPRLSARKVGEYTFDWFLKLEDGPQ